MDIEIDKEKKRDPFKRDEKGRLLPGHQGGPGRPKGKTLKEFAREYLVGLSDDDKRNFLKTVAPEKVWQMAEGQAHTSGTLEHTIPQNLIDLIRGTPDKPGGQDVSTED